jgi:hypothetical protein
VGCLEFNVEKVDPYGRLLVYLWLSDGRMFNEVLLREDNAQVATFPPNVKYVERLCKAQREARVADRGLWGFSEGQLCQQMDRENGIGGGCDAAAEHTSELHLQDLQMQGEEEIWIARTSRRRRRHERSLIRTPATLTASMAKHKIG